ncbi:MAG TPA: DUF481 domain-containing protein [Polyangia bacterium]|nr:DUF481 domain-containing protein [Polyangia bacterium]
MTHARPRFKAGSLFAVPLLSSILFASVAAAQTAPKFEYGKPDDVKPADPTKPAPPPTVEWRAQAKGGFTMTSGNSQTTGIVFGTDVSRKEGNNKLTLNGNVAYGRSNVITPVYVLDPVTAMPTAISGIARTEETTNNNWLVRGRYDRFFTANNSGYVSGQAAADEIAGKSFFGGGQAGYSRQLYKSAVHLTVLEIGYDFSYERYVQSPGTTHDPVAIHSARVFAGETLTLTKATGINASAEAFFNLNKEGAALDVNTGTPGVDPFHDIRVNAKVGLTTTIWKRLSIAFGFTLKYDENPAPLPIPSGAPAGIGYVAGFQPFADKVDTLTEATLIYTFL